MNQLRSLFLALLLAVAAAGASPARAEDANPAASTFIQSLGSQAIGELTGPNVPQPDREARFRKLLDSHFDMPAIAKFVLGRYWRTATEAERTDFQKLFEDYIVQSYSVRFGEYSGERFQVSGSSGGGDDITIVHSKIDRTGAEDVRLDWRLRKADGSFAIVDIIVEGVSMAVTQRSEFASVIQSKGGTVKGLIDALRAKTTQSASAGAPQ
jgi:phospholipid transport system substrate-binding protein